MHKKFRIVNVLYAQLIKQTSDKKVCLKKTGGFCDVFLLYYTFQIIIIGVNIDSPRLDSESVDVGRIRLKTRAKNDPKKHWFRKEIKFRNGGGLTS